MHPVILRGDHLVLRPPVPEDADAVLAACSDPEIARWTSVPSPYTRYDAVHWVTTEAPSGWAHDHHLVWYVFADADPSTLLASVGLHHLDLAGADGEIGYWTAPGARGRGIASTAVAIVSRWAFDELGLQRVGWVAATGNTASRRVADKLGFRIEGVARDGLLLDGRREDCWLASLLPGELTAPDIGPVIARPASAPAEPPPADPPEDAESNEVEITAGALHLRPWRREDAPALVPAVLDPDIALWNAFDGTGTADELATRFVEGTAASGPRRVPFAVVDATTGELLGNVALHRVGNAGTTAEIGYWTLPAARGRGVARHAVGALTRWGFAGLGLDRVEVLHANENLASCRVAEAAGFRYEATLRASHVYGDGRRHDEHLHGRLASDPEPTA